MLETRYIIWFLLPLFLFIFALWATAKRMKKPKEREDLKELFNQCFFCTVTLGVSVLIDKTLVESLIETYSFAYEQLELLRWLAYPILLLLLAHASKIISPKEEEIKIGERRPPPKRIKS